MDKKLVLEVSHLTKKYGAFTAVDDVSFSTQEGEIFGLLGPNGAGKTSIISCICTAQKITQGTITIKGLNVTKKPVLAKSIMGVVPQELVNHGFFSVEEILGFYSGFYGIVSNQERIQYLLKSLGLWEHKDKRVRRLSGGMKRRLLIAKALLHNPSLLLLDEPTVGVDVEYREHLWEFMLKLKKQGLSILLTTHYLEEAEKLCDRIGVLRNGKMAYVMRPLDLIKQKGEKIVHIHLRERREFFHPQLVSQNERALTFKAKFDTTIENILSELNIGLNEVIDIRTDQSRLTDVMKSLFK